MPGQVFAWKELNESQREYYRALLEQNRIQERFMPMDDGHDMANPVRIPNPLTLESIQEFAVLDRRVHSSRQRYAKAINAVHDEI